MIMKLGGRVSSFDSWTRITTINISKIEVQFEGGLEVQPKRSEKWKWFQAVILGSVRGESSTWTKLDGAWVSLCIDRPINIKALHHLSSSSNKKRAEAGAQAHATFPSDANYPCLLCG